MGLIRFILACGVVLCHTSLIFGYSPLSGDLAVQCFYIISGFYMALILNEKYIGKGSNFLFYSNRALKIYPIYWVNLILLVLWGLFVYRLGYPSTFTFYSTNWPLSGLTLLYFVFVNIFIIGLDSIFLFGLRKNGSLFFTSNFNKTAPQVYNFAFNSIAWTVGIELLFYLFAPFVVRKNVVYPIAILLCSLILRIILAHFGLNNAPWNYMFFPTQVMFFMGGVLAYRLYQKMKVNPVSRRKLNLMYLFLVAVVALYYQVFDESNLKQLFLFLSFILLIPGSFILTQKSKFDRILGNLSYPVYISQSLVIKLVNIKRFPKIISSGFTALIIIIAFSFLIDLLLTKPIESYRQSRIKPLLL